MQPARPARTHLVSLALCTALSALSVGSAFAFPLSGWEEGANAARRAVANAVEAEEPVVVYFQTDWCRWCKRLNDEYLDTSAVTRRLNGMRKVAVNPEKGAAEKELFQRYNGAGFPSFYVYVPAFDGEPHKLSPFNTGGGDSPEQFAQAIAAAIAHDYNAEGYRYSEKGQDERAISFYEKALEYDPNNGYACHSLAVTYQRLAMKTKDPALLKTAKEYYRRALTIDPADENSQRALAALGD